MSQQPHPDDDAPATHDGTGEHSQDTSGGELSEAQQVEAGLEALLQRGVSGANWFYWVAGLSLVNSVIMLSGGDTHFVVGMGVTLIADILAVGFGQQHPENAQIIKGVVFGFDLVVAAGVLGFGFLSKKRILFVFGLGMFLYLLDGLIFIWIQDWMSAAFHAFALFSMWGGLQAYRQLNQIELAVQSAADVQPA
jgi:hypothetical protein